MNDREYAIYKDVFNPNETDLDYFLRRAVETGSMTKEEAEEYRKERKLTLEYFDKVNEK